ncbi:MAG: hypothetical protein CVU61_02185 [Deltaproteobacteria bacterium HGW-Deltaproteobacteria-19]|jgi:lambda family phage tail tape measure protein|nr:MAG: hypothetical protein CVU61_02185 [Deltaproteobacteria bacterium HGW-Deltaproteobacteria-19]
MSNTRIQLIIEAVGKVDEAFNGLKRHLKDSQVETERLNTKTTDLTSSIGRLVASFASLATALAAVKNGISYLARIETATLGIASAFMTGGKYIDQTSQKALAAGDALKAAQGDARKIIEELQYANLQTIATLDELVNAYQVSLPVALAKGFNRQQVKEFTVAMVQAAGAIGLQMNQLGEETRSLLTAAIDPRNSRIATVLGIRNEDINKFKGDADGLFDFLMDKLSAYRVAGVEAQNTWAGLWSNFKDILSQSLGKGIEPLFDALKTELKSVADSIVVIDDQAKKIRWNPQFLEGVNNFRDGLQACIAEVYRLGMLLDKLGGSFAAVMHNVTLSGLRGNDRWAKMNDEYRGRYMASEKALQDMAMRSMGWKPVTAEIDKQMREAAAQGKKKFEQLQVDVGGEDPGTRQLLRYYRDAGAGGKPGWDTNPGRQEKEKGAAKLAKEWQNTLRDLNADIAKDGLDEFEQKLVDIGKKMEELRAKFKKVAGAEDEISKAQAALENNAVTQAARKDFDEYLKGLETEKKIIEEAEKKHRQVQAAREADIKSRLDELDVAEQEGTAHAQTLEERIRLTQELIALQGKGLEAINKEKDPTAWYAQETALRASRKNLLALNAEIDPIRTKLRQYGEEATNVGKNLGDAFTRAFRSAEDALAEFIVTGKSSFTDLVNSILKDLARIAIQKTITAPLANALSGINWGSLFSSIFGSAQGNVFRGGRIVPFAKGGTIAFNPTLFPMANGMGLMGEAGPEAVLPLTRLSNGNLGVQANSSQPSSVKVEIKNESGQKLAVTNSEASWNGQELIVSVWLDAFQRNAFGLRTALGG